MMMEAESRERVEAKTLKSCDHFVGCAVRCHGCHLVYFLGTFFSTWSVCLDCGCALQDLKSLICLFCMFQDVRSLNCSSMYFAGLEFSDLRVGVSLGCEVSH